MLLTKNIIQSNIDRSSYQRWYTIATNTNNNIDDGKNDGKDDDRNDLIDIKNDVHDCHLRLRILVTMKNNWVHWKRIEYIEWTQR